MFTMKIIFANGTGGGFFTLSSERSKALELAAAQLDANLKAGINDVAIFSDACAHTMDKEATELVRKLLANSKKEQP